ncbi:hypothetical protein Tco_0377942, partial [Tanacetum coccineum]
QGDQGFPFHTHAKSVKLSLISLLLYGFASAAEVSVRHGNSTHRAIAHLGRIVSVGLLVGSLASVCPVVFVVLAIRLAMFHPVVLLSYVNPLAIVL